MTDNKPIPSRAPAPLETVRNSGYIKPRMPAAPIDWEHWGLLRDCEVQLQQAVALSVNINPPEFCEQWDTLGAAYKKRWSIAISHARIRKLPLVLHYPNEPVSPVVLSRFVAWAKSLFRDLPPQLLAMAEAEPQTEPLEPLEPPDMVLVMLAESVFNGGEINWPYWVHQMPQLKTAEAARLMCALDPVLFEKLDVAPGENLDHSPNTNDTSKARARATMIQRLAEREGKEIAHPGEWLAWAEARNIKVHKGFTFAALERECLDAADSPKAIQVPSVVTAPLLKLRAQELRISELLTAQGYDPLDLKKRAAGRAGPKAQIRTLALAERRLFSPKSFDTAWQRLRDAGAISGAE